MLDICHHDEIQQGWHPTISRECYDWDIFIDYANSNVGTNPREFYSLLKKIKRKQKDSPYLLIKKNIDWFIAATNLKIRSINRKKYNYKKRDKVSRKIDEEGRAGYILLENRVKEPLRIPVYDFYDYERQKGIGIISEFLKFSVYADSPNNDEEYIIRSFFIDVFKFGCPREMPVSDSKGISTCSFHNPNDCVWEQLREEILGINAKNMKCYNCDHKYFNYVLNKLAEGKDFSEIKGFGDLLSNLPIEERYLVVEDIDDKKTKLSWTTYSRIDSNSYRWNLPGLLLGAATDSLIYFLAENDRRKLKKCPICERFFIAKDIKRKLCYPPQQCEKIHKRNVQREIMRKKRNKSGAGFDPRYI